MKSHWICIVLALWMMGCATGPSPEQLAAEQAAVKAERLKNIAEADRIRQNCAKQLESTNVPALLKYEKQLLGLACQWNLSRMEVLSQVWDFAITRSVYMEDTDASTEIAKHQLDVGKRGMNLPAEAANDCVVAGMKVIQILEGQRNRGYDELLDYFALYTQIYELAENPQGSLVSYRQAMNQFAMEQTGLSSRLDILLQ